MAVGLNTVREIIHRHPKALACNPDLVDDLVEYKKHRNRGVVTAARSVIQTLKEVNPQLLKSKHRGKPTAHLTEVLQGTQSIIPGAEVLNTEENQQSGESASESEDEAGPSQAKRRKTDNNDLQEIEELDAGSEDSDEYEDVDDDEEEVDSDDEEESNSEDEDLSIGSESKTENNEEEKLTNQTQSSTAGTIESSKTSKVVTTNEFLASRILTDEDFKKIKIENLRKKIESTSRDRKRKLAATKLNDWSKRKKKKVKEIDPNDLEEMPQEIDSEDLENESSDGEINNLPRFESIAKVNIRKRHDKESKMATMLAGREDREKFGRPNKRQNPMASTTNAEKSKKKNFIMMRQKRKTQKTKSFKERQLQLKNSLKRRYPK